MVFKITGTVMLKYNFFGFCLFWLQLAINTSANILSITTLNPNTILACGTGGTVIRSTNGGETWQELNSGLTEHLTSVELLPDLSYVVGTVSGKLNKGECPGIFTRVEDENIELPVAFNLGNYPNPFNGSTVINFTLPNESD